MLLERKLTEYLHARSGKTVQLKELYQLVEPKNSAKSKTKRKRFRFRLGEKKHEKQEEVLRYISLLEAENLVELKRKNLSIAKDFTLTGRISLSKRGDGFVKLFSGSEMFVPGKFTEGSITGDTVEVIPVGVGKKGRLEGEVLKITRRGRQFYRLKVTEINDKFVIGEFLDISGMSKEGFLKKKSLLSDIKKKIHEGDVLIVKLHEEWQDDNLFEAVFIRFESDDREDADLQRILMKHDLTIQYPDYVDLDDLPETADETNVSDWHTRVDLRELYTVTIDGEYTKDFDDAISFVDEGKRVRYYIHIADVSAYVNQDSALDDEAYHRATSVYIGNRVVPMLPPELSENLCSLVAGVDRLAFTVEVEGDYEGNIFHAKFYKSIINVDKRCTYESVEKEIENRDEWITSLLRVTDGLRRARIKSGRVDLDIKESYILTDERHEVKEIKLRQRLKSHILVEEMMLTANIKVAEFIRKKKYPVLYRLHEPMDDEKLESLNMFLGLYGFNIRMKDTGYDQIKKALAEVKGHPAEKIFNYILLRSFMQAYYAGEELGHWGLGFTDYCHFTSPIRRYPDLVVHRVLDAIIKSEEHPYDKQQVFLMGKHTSENERKAADAERDYFKLKICRFIAASGITKFTGYVTGIKPAQIFVELEEVAVEGVVTHKHFTNEGELMIKNDFSFYSKKHSTQIFLGQKIVLALDDIDYEEMRVYLKPLKVKG